MDAKEVLWELLCSAQQMHLKVGKTQLVKMLYLAEVEYVKATGNRLTSLEWIFYHHGPYCFELEKILSNGEIEREERTTKEGKKYFLYFFDPTKLRSQKVSVDPLAKTVIQNIVKTWGRKPLKQLVDHVYLHTDPMRNAVMRGEPLKFSSSDFRKKG